MCGYVHGETLAASLAVNVLMRHIVNFSVTQLPSPLKRRELQMIDTPQATHNGLFSIRQFCVKHEQKDRVNEHTRRKSS
jgi:hypothetical protein